MEMSLVGEESPCKKSQAGNLKRGEQEQGKVI